MCVCVRVCVWAGGFFSITSYTTDHSTYLTPESVFLIRNSVHVCVQYVLIAPWSPGEDGQMDRLIERQTGKGGGGRGRVVGGRKRELCC